MKQGDTIGKKLRRLSGSFFQKKSPVGPLDRDDCLLATHPSGHNAVYVENVTRRAPEKLAYKSRKKRDRQLKQIKRGGVSHGPNYGGNDEHGLAFLVPVPIYYGHGCPSGIPHGPDGGCAAVSVCLQLILPFLTVAVQGGCGDGTSGGGCTSQGSGCGGGLSFKSPSVWGSTSDSNSTHGLSPTLGSTYGLSSTYG